MQKVDPTADNPIYSRVYPSVYGEVRWMAESEQQPSLTPQAQQLLAAIQTVTTWMTRAELATAVDKKALNKWDIVLLEKLTSAGFIESRQVTRPGPIGYEWQYRIAGQPAKEE